MTYITIAGYPGAGTSTLARQLSVELGIPVISAGDTFRQMAAERGVSLEAFGRFVDRTPGIDRDLDTRLATDAKSREDCIAEGRVVGHFVPNALHVWLYARLDIRAERVRARSGETMAQVTTRANRERERYIRTYGIDIEDPLHYDLMLNTGRLSVEQTTATVLGAIRGTA